MLRELAKFLEIHPHHPNDDPSWDVGVTKEHFNGTSYGIWLQTKKKSLTGTMIMKHVFGGATYFQSNTKYDEMGICTWVKWLEPWFMLVWECQKGSTGIQLNPEPFQL